MHRSNHRHWLASIITCSFPHEQLVKMVRSHKRTSDYKDGVVELERLVNVSKAWNCPPKMVDLTPEQVVAFDRAATAVLMAD